MDKLLRLYEAQFRYEMSKSREHRAWAWCADPSRDGICIRRLDDVLVNQSLRFSQNPSSGSNNLSGAADGEDERRTAEIKRKRRERLLLQYQHLKFARAQHAQLRADIIKQGLETEEPPKTCDFEACDLKCIPPTNYCFTRTIV